MSNLVSIVNNLNEVIRFYQSTADKFIPIANSTKEFLIKARAAQRAQEIEDFANSLMPLLHEANLFTNRIILSGELDTDSTQKEKYLPQLNDLSNEYSVIQKELELAAEESKDKESQKIIQSLKERVTSSEKTVNYLKEKIEDKPTPEQPPKISKRGRPTRTDKEKLDVLRKWDNIDKSINHVFLEDFLKSEFGINNYDGSPLVAASTFHGWRQQLRKKGIDI